MEWMYTNVHLVDEAGNNVVLFFAYFTQGLRLATVRRFDAQWQLLDEHTGTTFGLLRASAQRHDISFLHPHGRDRWASIGAPHASRLEAVGPGFRVDVELHPTKAPYHAGDYGFLPFAERGWFYYYSLTRMVATGTLAIGTRAPTQLSTRGHAWVDHQWGPFYVTPFRNPRAREQYEWFSLQLSDGSDVILTSVWTPDGQLPSRDAYGGAGLVRADGSTSRLVGSHRLRRTAFHRDPGTGAVYSSGWRFVAPEWDCDLTIRPRHQDQMTPVGGAAPRGSWWAAFNHLVPLVNQWGAFWEGTCEVVGRCQGRAVRGDGFAELIKRYRAPHVVTEPPVIRSEGGVTVVVLRWRVLDWDPGVELHYRVRVHDTRGGVVARADELGITVFCFRWEGDRDERLAARIEAHSVDHVLRGEAHLSFLVGSP